MVYNRVMNEKQKTTTTNPLEEYIVMTGVPSWLQPPKKDTSTFYTEWTWETILERLSNGHTLASICRDDPAMPQDVDKLRRWIFKDPNRKQLYYEAQMIGTEQMADHLVEIASGDANPIEDVQRSTLRVNTLKWLIACRNRDRYGDKKQVENTVNVNISEAMDRAKLRVINGQVLHDALEHDG